MERSKEGVGGSIQFDEEGRKEKLLNIREM
jgi:hypothetical protein